MLCQTFATSKNVVGFVRSSHCGHALQFRLDLLPFGGVDTLPPQQQQQQRDHYRPQQFHHYNFFAAGAAAFAGEEHRRFFFELTINALQMACRSDRFILTLM
jgi:hypothetical protein